MKTRSVKRMKKFLPVAGNASMGIPCLSRVSLWEVELSNLKLLCIYTADRFVLQLEADWKVVKCPGAVILNLDF